MPEERVCTWPQNQWFLGKNWSPMVVIVEKQPYGGPWTRGDNTCGLKVLTGAPEVIRTPGLLISAAADSIQLICQLCFSPKEP
jgi:hypothetical protein